MGSTEGSEQCSCILELHSFVMNAGLWSELTAESAHLFFIDSSKER